MLLSIYSHLISGQCVRLVFMVGHVSCCNQLFSKHAANYTVIESAARLQTRNESISLLTRLRLAAFICSAANCACLDLLPTSSLPLCLQ